MSFGNCLGNLDMNKQRARVATEKLGTSLFDHTTFVACTQEAGKGEGTKPKAQKNKQHLWILFAFTGTRSNFQEQPCANYTIPIVFDLYFNSVRILRRMQTESQHQDVEGVCGHVQLSTSGSHSGQQDLLRPWRIIAQLNEHGRHSGIASTNGYT